MRIARRRSRCRAWIALGCAAFASVACNRIEAHLAPAPRGPNVLLVTIDTLRADHVGAYGNATAQTPTLDGLAAEGALFENASATAPLTLPSHTSILTGEYPPRHGVRHNAIFKLGPEHETVAERFQAAGYATGAFVAADVLRHQFGLAQGFDVYSDELPNLDPRAAEMPERSAQQIADAAIAWLGEVDRPFFLWTHYYDPHFPYRAPEPYRGRFAGDPYSGEVAYADHELGRVLAALRESGRYENTIVLVTADHGEGLGEHGEQTHTYLIYESTLHVPLIVRGPGVPKGLRVADVVSNAAIAPTLLALAGLPALAETDVASFTPALRGEPLPDAWAYAESLAGQLDHGWAPIQAVRTREAKYIRAPRAELFDLARDPGERENLLETNAAAHASGIALAESRIDSARAHEAQGARASVDAETRARIEALGYVVPSGGGTARANAPDPKDVERFSQLAFRSHGLVTQEKWREAEPATLAAIEKLPTSAWLRENLARIYSATGRTRLALASAEQAVQLAPDSAAAYSLVGELRFKLGDIAGGVAAMERSLALDPEQPGPHVAMIWKLRFGGSVEAADAHARRGLELAEWAAPTVEACGELWEMAGDYERARATYQGGVEHAAAPAPRLHMRLAIQHARSGDDEAFEREIAQAGDAARDTALATRLAVAYAARGDVERAEPIFRALVMRDRTRGAERMLARLLRESGRAPEAERLAPNG